MPGGDDVVVDRSGSGLFGLAMRHASVGMCLVAPDGRFIDVNEALCRMLGRTADDLLATTAHDVTHPDDRPAQIAQLDRLLARAADSYRLPTRFLGAGGTVVHAEITASAVRSDDGRIRFLVGQITDVTGRIEAERAAERADERLRGVIDSLLDPWVLMSAVRDSTGSIVDFAYIDANEAACRTNALTREALLSTTLLALFPEHATDGLLDLYAHVVDTGEPLTLDDHPFSTPMWDGQVRWFDNRAVKVGDGLSFTWRDVTDRVQLRHRLAVRADSDPLTGLANRHKLHEVLGTVFARTPRQGRRIAVLFCDLDFLKGINDTYGHANGDRVIQAVAERMAGCVRASDLVARIGGDEFVVILDGVRDEDDAAALAATVAHAVQAPVELAEGSVAPTVSIGIAVGDPGDDPEAVLVAADADLYRRKASRPAPGDVGQGIAASSS